MRIKNVTIIGPTLSEFREEFREGPDLYWFVKNNALSYDDIYGLDCCSGALANCLKQQQDDYNNQVANFGKAYNSMKDRVNQTMEILDKECDKAFPNPNSFGNITCKNMVDDDFDPTLASLWSAYNAEMAVATTALGLAKAQCYAVFAACKIGSALPPMPDSN